MHEVLAAVLCGAAGCAFYLVLFGLMAASARRCAETASARAQDEAEQLEYIRRFGAALNTGMIIDLDAYRARKANASSGSQVPSEASRSVAEAANPRAESLTPVGVPRNA